jgi:hypothetical protein
MARTDAAADELAAVVHQADSYVAGRVRNVVAFYWMSAGSLPAVEALMALCEELSVGAKQPFSAVHIVRANIGLPDAEVRRALGAGMKKYADVTHCLAVVTLGAGFWVSALQSAVTGIRMLAPIGGSMLRFVQRPEDLKGWFVPEHAARTGQTLDEDALLRSLDRLLSIGDAARADSRAE